MKKNIRSLAIALTTSLLMLSFFTSYKLSFNTIKYYYAYYFTDYKQVFFNLGKRYNLNIVYNVKESFLDGITLDVNLENKAQQMNDFELTRYSVMLACFFSKYPFSIIHDELQMVKLAKSLTLFSMPYGGTSIGSAVYLTSLGYDKGFTGEYIEKNLIHSKGFLTRHAMSTLENDVNVMAEQVFTDPKYSS